jgi:hypothetical protein
MKVHHPFGGDGLSILLTCGKSFPVGQDLKRSSCFFSQDSTRGSVDGKAAHDENAISPNALPAGQDRM